MQFTHSTIRLPVPRILPMTILVMAGLLAVKSGHLIFPATAETAAPHAPPAKPAAHATPASIPAATAKTSAGPSADEARAAIPSGALPSPLPPQNEPPVTDSERALLVDLRHRRTVLDSRETAIAARELAFQTIEKRLTARFEELSALQKRLEDLDRQRQERDEGSWHGLVKLYESMKPREAAVIFNELESSVLIPVLDRMKESKAAPILSAMLPDRARQVTVELASQRKKANAAPAAALSDRTKPAQAGG